MSDKRTFSDFDSDYSSSKRIRAGEMGITSEMDTTSEMDSSYSSYSDSSDVFTDKYGDYKTAKDIPSFLTWAKDKITVSWCEGALCQSVPLRRFAYKSSDTILTFLNNIVNKVQKITKSSDEYIFSFFDENLGEEYDEYQEEIFNAKDLIKIFLRMHKNDYSTYRDTDRDTEGDSEYETEDDSDSDDTEDDTEGDDDSDSNELATSVKKMDVKSKKEMYKILDTLSDILLEEKDFKKADKFIVDKKIDINECDYILDDALGLGEDDVVEYLLKKGIKMDSTQLKQALNSRNEKTRKLAQAYARSKKSQR